MTVRIINADVFEGLAQLEDESVQCVVTSPPYWGLRCYGVEGQLGLEPSLSEHIDKMVAVFAEVHRVLRKDGTLWLNYGDCYASSVNGRTAADTKAAGKDDRTFRDKPFSTVGPICRGKRMESGTGRWGGGNNSSPELKPKDLAMIPNRLAIALQEAGWWVRSEIIWCLSGGAWVYARTQKGDMPVMVKDLVRLDPRTVKLWNGEKWTQVLGWGPSNDTSERLELVLRSGERIGCTGGHLWPTQRGNVEARNLHIGDIISSCTLPEPTECECPQYLTEDALWLVGLFLAEGSWTQGKAQIALLADEVQWLPRIEAIARYYGGSCRHTTIGNDLAVRLYGPVLPAILRAYIGGSVVIDKHLKVAAWRLPNNALGHVIQGYLDGDGHNDSGNNRWRIGFCRNYALERDLRTAAARLGAKLTLKPAVGKYQNGDSPTFLGEWRWETSGHHNEKDRAEIVEVRASRARKFWDIAVEDDPHLFALASGVLTHNCKPNPMPESIKDRPTSAHEKIFLLTKASKYFYDSEAIREDRNQDEDANGFRGGSYVEGQPSARKQTGNKRIKIPGGWDTGDGAHGTVHRNGRTSAEYQVTEVRSGRNKRNVWTIATTPYSEAHFATFPPELPETCIKAGSKPGDMVLDPFGGAGTTGLVADQLGRDCTLIELNPEYAAMAERRIQSSAPLFAQVETTASEKQLDLEDSLSSARARGAPTHKKSLSS